jgi:two-component system, chemotaxis family, chemotaxis protein CheY
MRRDNHSDASPPLQEELATFDERLDSAPVEGDAAHDLYNLLAVIIGVCESLADDLSQRPQHRELARVGMLAADRAAALVAKLRSNSGPPASANDPDEGAPPEVLLVEDDPDLLLLLTAAFVREGFRTHSARNGRQGVELLRTLKPDLMVTDIVMPEMEGIGTILEARRCSPETKVIAISGGGHYGRSKSFLEWASELGADEVLAKPFRMSSLIMAARVVLDQPPPLPSLPVSFDDEVTQSTRLAVG